MIQLTVNDKQVQVDAPAEMPLLWALRDLLGLTGTKFGCGIAQCGACTVHLDGQPVRSCVTPVGTVTGKRVTTIEGLAAGGADHPVQIISDGVDRLDHGSPAETIRVHVESGSCRRTSSSPHPRATPPAEPSHGLWRAGASDDTRRGTPGRPGRVSQSPFSSPQSLPSTPGSILAFS
jgi:hypothetical protein